MCFGDALQRLLEVCVCVFYGCVGVVVCIEALSDFARELCRQASTLGCARLRGVMAVLAHQNLYVDS